MEEKKKKASFLDCNYGKSKKIEILHKKSLEILLRAELDSTIETLEKKTSNGFIELDLLNEECIGSLMMFSLLKPYYVVIWLT